MGDINLFTFPSAGSSKLMYRGFEKYLNDSIEFHPVELAGRGERIRDSIYKNMEEVVNDLFSIIELKTKNKPFAFWGHSLGALISYYLALKLQENNLPGPKHLFLSGRNCPEVSRKESSYYMLNLSEMKSLLIDLGGTPKELIHDENFLDFILPIIRADFKLLSQFNISHFTNNRIDCDITILNGKYDNSTKAKVDWNYTTNGECDYFLFDGGHFFINDFKKEVVNIINLKLL